MTNLERDDVPDVGEFSVPNDVKVSARTAGGATPSWTSSTAPAASAGATQTNRGRWNVEIPHVASTAGFEREVDNRTFDAN